MQLEQLKSILTGAQVAELKSGHTYVVEIDQPLEEVQIQNLRRSFAENGVKVFVLDHSLKMFYLEPKSDVTVEDRTGDPVALYCNKAAESLATQVLEYATMPRVLARVADARAYQMKDWPGTQQVDAGGRSTEEWIVLLQAYQAKLVQVYTESDGSTKEGLDRLAKYAAIQANLALWLLQAAQGAADNFEVDLSTLSPEEQKAHLLKTFNIVEPTVAPGETDGCKYHSSDDKPFVVGQI